MKLLKNRYKKSSVGMGQRADKTRITATEILMTRGITVPPPRHIVRGLMASRGGRIQETT